MNLTELYRQLSYGELNNLSLSEGASGDIEDARKPQIVLAANEALRDLYRRFMLKEGNIFLEQVGFLTNYDLLPKFAQTNYDAMAGHSFYIKDTTTKPFLGDVVKVLEIWDGWGRKVPINEQHLWRSVFTPMPTRLQIPHPVAGAPLSITYQASHPVLSEDDDPEVEWELPDFLVGSLKAFIAGKVFGHMNTQESSIKAAAHMKTYETICVEVVEQDLVSTGALTSGLRFEQNGWV